MPSQLHFANQQAWMWQLISRVALRSREVSRLYYSPRNINSINMFRDWVSGCASVWMSTHVCSISSSWPFRPWFARGCICGNDPIKCVAAPTRGATLVLWARLCGRLDEPFIHVGTFASHSGEFAYPKLTILVSWQCSVKRRVSLKYDFEGFQNASCLRRFIRSKPSLKHTVWCVRNAFWRFPDAFTSIADASNSCTWYDSSHRCL